MRTKFNVYPRFRERLPIACPTCNTNFPMALDSSGRRGDFLSRLEAVLPMLEPVQVIANVGPRRATTCF